MSEQTPNDGGPVHPVYDTNWEGTLVPLGHGMSLRDYLAAHAPSPQVFRPREHYEWSNGVSKGPNAEPEVSRRYRYADAMIRQREQEPSR